MSSPLQLVDIQPSKEGGFQGTVASELKRESLASYFAQGGRKKVRLQESWRGRAYGCAGSGGRKAGLGIGRRDWNTSRRRYDYNAGVNSSTTPSGYDCRLRKSMYPRRTIDELLQNIMVQKRW